MIRLLCVICFFIIAFPNLYSKEVASNKGKLIERTFKKIGITQKEVKVNVIYYNDIYNKVESTAVVIERYGGNNLYSTTFDKIELDELIKSFKFLDTLVTNESIGEDRKEISYISESGVEIGCYTAKDKLWYFYLMIENKSEESYVELNKDDFLELLNLLIKAKELL